LKATAGNSAAVTIRARFLHAALTPAGVAWPPETSRGLKVDFIFILALVALYAATCWLIVGISRLGGLK
jgi:uncharacterized membrane protein